MASELASELGLVSELESASELGLESASALPDRAKPMG